jgi:transposase
MGKSRRAYPPEFRQHGQEDALTPSEREELARLRRENRQLRREREILSKATAWFARETNRIPTEDPDS